METHLNKKTPMWSICNLILRSLHSLSTRFFYKSNAVSDVKKLKILDKSKSSKVHESTIFWRSSSQLPRSIPLKSFTFFISYANASTVIFINFSTSLAALEKHQMPILLTWWLVSFPGQHSLEHGRCLFNQMKTVWFCLPFISVHSSLFSLFFVVVCSITMSENLILINN